MASVNTASLPDEVQQASKHRILDTLAAMVSGRQLLPGHAALKYVKELGGVAHCNVIASNFQTNAVNAALANAMFAHADETDDFEPSTKAHPGSSSVPAALAMAEKNGCSGDSVIRSVALGYDLCNRLLEALGAEHVRGAHRSAEGTSSTFCALGAAAPLANFDELRMRYAISYAAQQVSGLWSWVKDKDHVEKAFDFSGMGVRNGVMAVTMVESGMTGVFDVLDGTHNLLIALSRSPNPEAMVAGLGRRFYVTESAIKTFSVGYPNQSALDAILQLRKKYDLTAKDVQSVLVKLPTDAIGIVANSSMPDVCCPHLISVALLKGAVSFDDSHDFSLMEDPDVLQVRNKVTVVGDEVLMDPAAPRGAIVELELADGRRVTHHNRFAPGNKERPLSTADVNAKAHDLMAPVLGTARSTELIEKINGLETIDDMRSIRHLWA